MELNFAAAVLKELGHPTRLEIYKALIKAGYQGMPVGELQKKLGIPASTLSHHLSSLISVSLVRQERQGRTLFCHACYEILAELMAFLTEECCSGTDDLQATIIPREKSHEN
ncbi:helix-turn-helix transcriptional regulator [Salmonella enterica subsp. enterica serovar Hvittingfoss]|nr:helix-turn-helix transcriptional regulator [Salmonella enterica subsp. enterica serovar Hvittingfoss]